MVLVYIRSRRRAMSQSGHPALTCLPNGEVCGNSFGVAGQLQQWEMETHTEGKIAYVTIRASNGNYLSAKLNGGVQVSANSVNRTISDHEKWFVQNCSDGGGSTDGCISLMSFHGKYLVNDCRFDCGKTVRADREQICEWTKWIIVDDPKAMTSKTAVGKVATAGVYTAAIFLPLFGAIGVVTLAKRSMVYGGSTTPYNMYVVNENDNNNNNNEEETERRGGYRNYGNTATDFLIKVPIKFKTQELSKSIGAGADAVASTASTLALNASMSLSDITVATNDTTLTPEEEEEMERRLLVNKQERLLSSTSQ